MRISSFRKVCPNPKLLELMAEVRSKDKVRSKAFVRKLLDVNQNQVDQEALFRVFLGCLYESRDSKDKDSAKRLFRTFSSEFENLTE